MILSLSLCPRWPRQQNWLLHVSICNIHVKHQILVINEMIWYKILLKPKVLDQEKLCGILWTFVKYFGILQNLTRNYEILWKFMKVDESYDIPCYFFGQILCFHSILFACGVLFAFRNFVRWRTKFSCLLLYRITSRQYRQIFCHRQTIGDISNIADT